MNILILFGSPHRNGTTAKLLEAFLHGVRKTDTVKIVRLYELMPTPCNACGYCKAADGCSKKDLDGFMADFQAADAVVVAAPMYNLSFPAPMKALFDRFQRYYEAHFRRKIQQPIEKPKKSVIMITSGSDGQDGFQIIKKQCAMSFSILNTKICGMQLCEKTDENGVTESDMRIAFELSKKLYE